MSFTQSKFEFLDNKAEDALNLTFNDVVTNGNTASVDILVNGLTIGRGSTTTTPRNSTAIGDNALSSNTTGTFNTAVGRSTLLNNTTGFDNTAIGDFTLSDNTTGSRNVAVGYSLYSNTTGSWNTSVGVNSLIFLSSGSDNIAIGGEAGRFISTFSNLTSASNSVFIGRSVRPLSNNQTNQIVIGHNAVGVGSNSVVLGNTDIETTILRGRVRFTNGTAATPTISFQDEDTGIFKVSTGVIGVTNEGVEALRINRTTITMAAAGSNIVLRAPNGIGYSISVNNSGELVVLPIE